MSLFSLSFSFQDDKIPWGTKRIEWDDFRGEISLEKNQEKVGKIFKVMIDKKEAGRYLGRTEFDSVEVDNEVIIQSNKKLTIGEFVNVKINKAFDYDLEGTVV
jgi:ribosomal protein S12 methylthiotransferase